MDGNATADKTNDEELRKSQRLLLDAELIGHIGSWEIDLVTGDVITTEGNRRLFFGDDKTRGNRFEDYAEAVHPDDRQWVMRRREELLEGTGSPDIEYRIIMPDGEVRVIRGLQRVVRDANGRPVRAFGTNADMTDSKRAEAGRLMLESAISQVDAMIVITDAAGRMQYVNPAFETVTGYTRGEVLGKSTSMLKSGEHDSTFYRDLWDTISSGRAWKGTFINRRKDGTRFTEEATISPVFDERGAIVNYVAAKHDRTREMLLEGQLRQAQKMESVGRLAGGVAHDFNNMLQVMGSYVELSLELAAPGEALHGYLEQVQAAVKRSADLTGQLLAFARKQTTSPRVLALNDAVASSLKILQRLIGEDVELVWVPGASAPSVKMDPTQLYQVLANLAINARDAIAGVGRLTIETGVTFLDEEFSRLHPESLPGAYAVLTVSDTGRGMDKETQAHIFEPFFTTKKVGEGTGLGLATVYGIVKQNNGFIVVQSEPGKGSSFTISLPLENEASGASLPGEQGERSLGGTETLLVVEDEQAILALSRTALTGLGYAVLTARLPEEALAVAQAYDGPIHLLITDVVMPQMNGRDLSAQLAGLKPGIRSLFMSGYTADVIAHQGVLDAGVQFISKPFSLDMLARKVREALADPGDARAQGAAQ